MPQRMHPHEISVNREVDGVTGSREASLANHLATDLVEDPRQQRVTLQKGYCRSQLVLEQDGRRAWVLVPPRGCGADLFPRGLGELDPQRLRSSASNAAASRRAQGQHGCFRGVRVPSFARGVPLP
jgi:hypothetical protein